MKFSSDIVVFDLEASCKTFGKNEVEESNIIEIGAVKLDKKTLEIKSELSILISPRDYPVLPEITEITGIKPEELLSQPLFDRAAEAFTEWCGERNKFFLAGWGLYYDLPLLRKEFRVFGLEFSKYFLGGGFDIRGLGYYWLAKNNFNTSGISIEKVMDKMGISGELQFHRALDDAKATAMILQKIMSDS